MRWTANDSLAYRAVTDAGERLRKTWDEKQAGDVYKAGSAVTGPENEATVAEYAAARDQISKGLGEYQDLTPEQRQTAAAAYGQAETVGKQYHVGRGNGNEGLGYDAAPTRAQQRMGGMQAQGDYYTGLGNTEKANAIYDQVDQMDARGLQREASKVSIESGKLDLKTKKRMADLDEFIAGSSGWSDEEFIRRAAAHGTQNGNPNEGFTFRKGEDGSIYLQKHNRETRELIGETKWDGNRDAIIGNLVKNASAAQFDAARKEAKQDKRNDKDDTRKDQELGIKKDTLTAQVAHWGDLLNVQKAQLGVSQENAKRIGKLTDAQIKSLESKTDALMDKLPEGDKLAFGMFKGQADAAAKEGRPSTMPMFQALRVLAKHDASVDPYKLSGVPNPDARAAEYTKSKWSPSQIEADLSKWDAAVGAEYGDDVRKALRNNAPTKPSRAAPDGNVAPTASAYGLGAALSGAATDPRNYNSSLIDDVGVPAYQGLNTLGHGMADFARGLGNPRR